MAKSGQPLKRRGRHMITADLHCLHQTCTALNPCDIRVSAESAESAAIFITVENNTNALPTLARAHRHRGTRHFLSGDTRIACTAALSALTLLNQGVTQCRFSAGLHCLHCLHRLKEAA